MLADGLVLLHEENLLYYGTYDAFVDAVAADTVEDEFIPCIEDADGPVTAREPSLEAAQGPARVADSNETAFVLRIRTENHVIPKAHHEISSRPLQRSKANHTNVSLLTLTAASLMVGHVHGPHRTRPLSDLIRFSPLIGKVY